MKPWRRKTKPPLIALDEYNGELCEALGLDAGKTHRVVVTFEAGHVVRVTAHQRVWDKEARELVDVLKRFVCVERDPLRRA